MSALPAVPYGGLQVGHIFDKPVVQKKQALKQVMKLGYVDLAKKSR